MVTGRMTPPFDFIIAWKYIDENITRMSETKSFGYVVSHLSKTQSVRC